MSTERPNLPTNKQIIDEAAEWFVEINAGDADRAARQRFDAWLRLSPEHVRAYLRILPVWEEGAQLDAGGNGDPHALIAWAREGNNVVALGRGAGALVEEVRKSRPRPSWRLALAACAAFVVVALTAWLLIERRSTYETGIGDQRLVALSDGSKIELNSRSKLKVRFTERERTVDLLEGQALFRVAKDKARPFMVRSGDAVVRVLGTQFDVYKKRTGTVVTVVEGRVAILPLTPSPLVGEGWAEGLSLTAGEQAVLVASARPKPKRANIALATAWTQQRLEFSRTPLPEVAEEFNRYNERQLIVKGGGLETFNVSGSFSSSDPASLVRFLRAQPGIRVSETESAIHVAQQ
jgi:transmembrane sensor